MESILSAIKTYMKAAGVTKAQLSKMSNISEAKLASILNGVYPLNSADYGIICEALGVKYSSFYFVAKGICVSSK